MPKTDTLTLSTAAELSEAVAEKVPMKGVGFDVASNSRIAYVWNPEAARPFEFDITDPRHWMLVVEAMEKSGYEFIIRSARINGKYNRGKYNRGKYKAMFWITSEYGPSGGYHSDYDSLKSYSDIGIAIGLAALRAVGVEFEPTGELVCC